MIEVKKFSGALNKDDKEENILPGDHIDALNMRFYGTQSGLSAENIVGNSLIRNEGLPEGINECIGAIFDQVKQRLIWMNYNDGGNNGIYQYDLKTLIVRPLLVSFINSQTDIFGFDLDFPAASIDIIYTTENDGDILTWVTRNKRPKALNILQAINNTYGTNWLEKYLDVAKEPPSIPIKCAFEDDNTVTVNNFRKKLVKPKYRFWYADNEKSSWSAQGEIPVPLNYADPQIDTDPTKNCRVGCVVQTGDDSVKKIEIAFAESLGNVFSNFFSVIILDKDKLSIPDNDVYIWRFYNDEAYVFVDKQESDLLFDRVPDKANCQALLNGNIIAYGGITEGLDPIVPNVVMSTGVEYPLAIDYTNILSVTQYGVEGFQQGRNISFVVLGKIMRGQTFTAAILVGATTYIITYTAQIGDTAFNVLIGLASSAGSQGFSQVSITPDKLVIFRANQVLLRSNVLTTNQTVNATFIISLTPKTITINGGAVYLPLFVKGVKFYINGNTLNINPFTTVSSIVSGTDLVIMVDSVLANETITTDLYLVPTLNSSIPAYNSSSKENWALFYFDEKGKTNGATTSTSFSVSTQSLGLQKTVNTLLFLTPYIQASIFHRPPLWAKTYKWGRTPNLTKQAWLFWISGRTYKDDKYAYISIEGINIYKKQNPNSVVSYDYQPGDRIKFYALYTALGEPSQIYGNEHDYEVYDEVENPVLSNLVKPGRYIKILLPTVSTQFDFGSGQNFEYSNYYIELYTPAKSAAEGLDAYYEFGEEYGIGNPGTTQSFHQGQIQNQSPDLSQPATFKFNRGDAWYRTRDISIGNKFTYDMVSVSLNPSNVLGQKLRDKDYEPIDYTIKDNIAKQGFVNNYNSPGWTISVGLNSYTFKVTGILNFRINYPSTNGFVVQIYVVYGTTSVSYILGSGNGPLTIGEDVVMNVNKDIPMPPNSKAFLVLNSADPALGVDVISGFLTYAESKRDFLVGVVDQNFSDFYTSKVNSNGRALVVNPDEKTSFFGTLIRYGLAYQQNTNINQINRFFPENFNEVDRGKGDIQRLKARDRILRIFQNRAVGQLGIFGRFIQNNEGNSELISTSDILTPDNIQYYNGEFGLGDQYTGLVSASRRDFFADPVRGYQIRVSDDGITPISELYKGQFYIRQLLMPYNEYWQRENGGRAKILGCYDFLEEQYITSTQSGTSEFIVTPTDISDPTAVGDAYITTDNEILTIAAPGVMANDIDQNPSTLTVQPGTFNTAHGVIVLNSNGSFVYTPALNYIGTDSFVYTLINQYGLTATGTINLNIILMAPGTIVMWSGNPATPPAGWALCDGLGGTPNLKGRFIVGYDVGDPDYDAIADAGGTKTVTLAANQQGTLAAKTKNDDISGGGTSSLSLLNLGGMDVPMDGAPNSGSFGTTINAPLSAAANAHENRPPYYTLAYIIKL